VVNETEKKTLFALSNEMDDFDKGNAIQKPGSWPWGKGKGSKGSAARGEIFNARVEDQTPHREGKSQYLQ